jgi:cold shock CspA family protein
MTLPVQTTFRHMLPDESVEKIIRRKARSLERFFPRLTGCRVMVEAPHRHRRKGYLYRVRVDLGLPRRVLVAGRAPSARQAHHEVEVAVRDAFDAARRILQDAARKRRGQIKEHSGTPYARVILLRPEKGCGFLVTSEGRQLYFHAHSVLDGFHKLRVGSRVRYAEEGGDEGPQASTVVLSGRRTRGPSGARP